MDSFEFELCSLVEVFCLKQIRANPNDPLPIAIGNPCSSLLSRTQIKRFRRFLAKNCGIADLRGSITS